MSSQIKIKIESFRAIHNAQIDVDGITVVTGENGCGKSTISKLLYQTYKTTNDFHILVKRELYDSLFSLLKQLEEITNTLSRHEMAEFLGYKRISWINILRKSNDFTDLKQQLLPRISKLKNDLSSLPQKSTLPQIERLYHSLRGNDSNEYQGEKNVSALMDAIYNRVNNEIEKAEQKLLDRPISLLVEAIQETFSSPQLPGKFEIYEHSTLLTDWDSHRISNSFLVQEQVYTDTPMAVGLTDSIIIDNKYSYWDDLNELLKKKPDFGLKENVSFTQHIENNVFYGNVTLDPDESFGASENFIYTRKDGLTIDLLDCATGLKSFAILQLLYKNGTLRKDTLVIIDEPEAHLHPQWVVEYARLVVLLNKEVGVRFFIASHHPDMISAIRYIAEKEQIDKNLNFYLAEKRDSGYDYDYRHVGLDIEPIFASFNIALDRINQYGATE